MLINYHYKLFYWLLSNKCLPLQLRFTEWTSRNLCIVFLSPAKGWRATSRRITGLRITLFKTNIAGCYRALEQAYRIVMWSRLASHVAQLGEHEPSSLDDIKLTPTQFNWQSVFSNNETFIVDFSGGNDDIRHTQFAQLVKTVLSTTRKRSGKTEHRKRQPDIRIAVLLHKGKLVWSPDLSWRYAQTWLSHEQGAAPLRETLAAVILFARVLKPS